MKGNIYIFGAHSRARTLAVYLRFLYPEISIEAFLYDNEEPNPKMAEGIPVAPLEEGRFHTEYPVYIGTRGIFHEKITKRLKELGFEIIYPVTVELDMRLRNQYLEKYYAGIQWDFTKIESLEVPAARPSAAVYVTVSAYDSPLKEPYEKKPYEKLIQAGAALTDKRIPGCFTADDEGDNISLRNKQYCELTALYWIWKNAGEEIVGLSHYRRHFLLPEDWELRMRENRVDVILPVPLYVAPSLAGNFKSRHGVAEWECMMDCLKKRSEQEFQEAGAFFQGNLYSPCNMFIMRREVMDDLCGWLFPVLFQISDHVGQKEDAYQNRYPGFLSERLVSFFFEKNREKYRIVYADKNFLA